MKVEDHINDLDTITLGNSSLLPGSGATWHRIDLHLHSPGVESFTFPDGMSAKNDLVREKVVERYVEQLVAQKISVGAITDYNGVRSDWFKPIQARAASSGITLLPGIELSFKNVGKYGLHVLAIFYSDTDLAGLDTFLRSLDKDPAIPLFDDQRKNRDIDPKANPAEALKEIAERYNCLLIFPHPDQNNGLCKSMKPSDAAQFLKEIWPDAIEHCPEPEIDRLKSTGILPFNFWKNLAFVEFSDPKRIEEIGTKCRSDGTPRATYLKLSATDLDALRLAFHDPETRLAIGSIPPSVHARIRSMVVSGSGFLGNLTISWNDDLNIVIGGRGTGKSAILETLRYAFGIPPYSDQSYREELVRHALGSGGKVEVLLERPLGNKKTRLYLISRIWGEEPRVFEAESGKAVDVSAFELLGPAGGPTIFGQREIFAVSGSEEYRLALLDELIGEEARERAMAVRESLDLLRSNAQSILNVRKKFLKRDEYQQRLKKVDYEIGIYERHGAAEKLKKATDLRSDGQHLRSAVDAIQRIKKDWEQIGQDVLPPLKTASRNLLRGQSEQRRILEEASQVLETLKNNLRGLLDTGTSSIEEAEQSIQVLWTRWQKALQPLEEEISKIKQEAQTEALDPDRLLKLTEERASLLPFIEELNQADDQLKKLFERRSQLLNNVGDRRHKEHQLRRERAEAIERFLQGRLRLEVEFKGQKEDYKKRLSSLLKGSGLSQDALEQLVTPEATDGIALAEAAQTGAEEIQDRFGLTSGMTDRLLRWLIGDESRLFEVQTLIPSDALRVQLKVDDKYRPLVNLSVGQRATAILLLIFALEGRILVLDQPEDDLDNRFVYEDIVQILRDQKGLRNGHRRQIIAATHNANIPVIGDAELVLALEAHENRAQVIGRASIDDRSIRELVKSIMEGGEEAFQRRVEKYGGMKLS